MNNENVKIKNGTFYLSSKEDRGEGWEKKSFPNPQNKNETLTRYHKELSVKGELFHVSIGDDRFVGKTAKIGVKNKNTAYWVEVPIMSKKGVKTVDDYFKSIVGSLLTAEKGQEVVMFVNSKNKDKRGYLYKNIVMLDSDNSVIKSPYSFKDAPRWKITETKNEFGEKEKKYDATETNKFYIDILNKAIEKFKSGENNDVEAPTPTATPEQAFEPAVVEEDEQELPF